MDSGTDLVARNDKSNKHINASLKPLAYNMYSGLNGGFKPKLEFELHKTNIENYAHLNHTKKWSKIVYFLYPIKSPIYSFGLSDY